MAWLKRGKETTIDEVFLRNIGASSLDEINDWFKKAYANNYRIDKIEESVELACSFKNKPVRIIGDYDADGVTSTAILYLALIWAGFTNVSYRIPKRFSEGFGINETIIDEVDEGLIITCDNGVAQIEAIKKAKEKGLTVIIIDHHLPKSEINPENGKEIVALPPADIIIDPNAIEGSADFDGYCGAGLSYKFACALLHYEKRLCRVLKGFAAIGTVADVMELREENYEIVRNGLNILKDVRFVTTGLYALISAYKLTGHVSAKDIGFKIGPVINAASRMKDDGAADAVRMLTFNGPYQEAIKMAEKFVETNKKRKESKEEGLRKAQEIIENECLFGDVPLVVYIPEINEGIVGIIAGKLCEEYKVPAIVLTDTCKGVIKGSSRACGNYNMKKELDKCSELLLHYGGHEGAAGLSLYLENLEALRTRLISGAPDFKCESLTDVYYDLEIKASDIPKTLQVLERYEPFGKGNQEILFKVEGFSVVPRNGDYKKLMGTDSNIVKMYSSNATAIGFDMAEKMKNLLQPKNLDMVGTLSYNYYGSETECQIEFSDFVSKDAYSRETPLAEKLKKMSMSK